MVDFKINQIDILKIDIEDSPNPARSMNMFVPVMPGIPPVKPVKSACPFIQGFPTAPFFFWWMR